MFKNFSIAWKNYYCLYYRYQEVAIKCGIYIIYILLLLTAIGLSPGGSSPTLVQTKIKMQGGSNMTGTDCV
jgi:hypothetical protein